MNYNLIAFIKGVLVAGIPGALIIILAERARKRFESFSWDGIYCCYVGRAYRTEDKGTTWRVVN